MTLWSQIFLTPVDDMAEASVTFAYEDWQWHDGADGFEQHVWQDGSDAEFFA
jgi:hypothetical protein